MNPQLTLADRISISGGGLHTGKEVRISILPAKADHGIEFRRTDLPTSEPIKAITDNVISTTLATTIGKGHAFVATVEHLMSALHGLGVDNAIVEVDADELPIMDGSAASFVYLMRMAGLQPQSAPKRYIVIDKPIVVAEGDKRASLLPDGRFKVSYSIDYSHPMIQVQSYEYMHDPAAYELEISQARTFGFLSEYSAMKSNGFAAGGSLDNAVLVGNRSVLNQEGLRFQDEFVRHKILDAIGDLYMAGKPIIGHYSANKSGHALNNLLMRKLQKATSCWHEAELAMPVTDIQTGMEQARMAIK